MPFDFAQWLRTDALLHLVFDLVAHVGFGLVALAFVLTVTTVRFAWVRKRAWIFGIAGVFLSSLLVGLTARFERGAMSAAFELRCTTVSSGDPCLVAAQILLGLDDPLGRCVHKADLLLGKSCRIGNELACDMRRRLADECRQRDPRGCSDLDGDERFNGPPWR